MELTSFIRYITRQIHRLLDIMTTERATHLIRDQILISFFFFNEHSLWTPEISRKRVPQFSTKYRADFQTEGVFWLDGKCPLIRWLLSTLIRVLTIIINALIEKATGWPVDLSSSTTYPKCCNSILILISVKSFFTQKCITQKKTLCTSNIMYLNIFISFCKCNRQHQMVWGI